MSSRVIKLLHAILFRTAATTGPVLGICSFKYFIRLLLVVFSLFTSSYSFAYCYQVEEGAYLETQSGTTNATAGTMCQALIDSRGIAHMSNYGAAGSGRCYYYASPSGTYLNIGTWVRSGEVESLCAGETPPDPVCPEGAFWDFDSQSCKYPQDDACDSIGASWDPAASACQCDSPTAALVTAAGVTRCMQLRDDSCTKDSPDFKGYATYGDSAGQAVCDGRASCPDGGTPGYVGSGDTMSAVCYSNTPAGSENCDGQAGLQDGVEVCIPNPGDDPDFPDCDGVVGTFNGVKRCIDKPGGHAGCSAGETPGYVGAGDNAQFTCIPSDYKPETCPPGQYVTNAATGGFGCATTGGQSKDDVAAGKTPGTGSGTSQTTVKDAVGNVVGTEESELQIDLTGLTEDTPANNYKTEMDEFSDSELDSIDTDSIVSSFSGADGAFTQRNSLTNLSSFVVTHTIGNSTNCNGSLPFFGMTISCEKFATYNRIVGWMIFIYTLINIYNVIMRKSESGV